MWTQCNSAQFEFARVEGRSVVASFDGGAITSDAGGVPLEATDRAIGLVDRFAACFVDRRRGDLIEHAVRTLMGQCVFGIALGYEDQHSSRVATGGPRRTLVVFDAETGTVVRDCSEPG